MNRLLNLAVIALLITGQSALCGADQAPSALPPVKDVLKKVLDRAKEEEKNDRDFKAHYAYTRIKITDELNSKGKLTKHEVKRSEKTPRPPVVPVSTTIGAATNERKGVPQAREGEFRGKAFEKSDFPLSDDLLGRFRFNVVGREALNGRTALILDFRPTSKGAPVRNIKDRFINKAAGRVWVDEADYAVARADLYLTESVSVLGGLVGAVHKCKFAFQRGRTPEGIWFTREMNWRLEGRQVFVSKTIEHHETTELVRRAG